MTLVIFHYPALLALFGLCMLLTVLTQRLKRGKLIPALLTGLSGVALVLFALAMAVPLAELLLVLAALLLAACICASKEDCE